MLAIKLRIVTCSLKVRRSMRTPAGCLKQQQTKQIEDRLRQDNDSGLGVELTQTSEIGGRGVKVRF